MSVKKSNRIIPLSEHFGVSPDAFIKLGVLDVPLNTDTPLFIDPQLLKNSTYEIFNTDAWNAYQDFYHDLYHKVQMLVQEKDNSIKDKIVKSLKMALKAKEPIGLCLGYSKSNNRGRGIGKDVANVIVRTATDVVSRGIKNPGMFSVLFLLEEGIGGDFISDLTANIILIQLARFTQDISKKLNIKTKPYMIKGQSFNLPAHPFERTYILFVPCDIVSLLPTQDNLDGVLTTLVENLQRTTNDDIRYRVNNDIAEIWAEARRDKLKTSEKKERLRRYIYTNNVAVDVLTKAISETKTKKFDFKNDPNGLYLPVFLPKFLAQCKVDFSGINNKLDIIDRLINGFKHLLENDNMLKSNLLYNDGTKNKNPRKEKAWQSAFKLYVTHVLQGVNIDVTPEFETGVGPVDFKFSEGESFKVLIEIKLSSNPKYADGLSKQLEAYLKATTNVKRSYFIFIDVETDPEKSTDKRNKLLSIKNEYKLDSYIVPIDGTITPSASRL